MLKKNKNLVYAVGIIVALLVLYYLYYNFMYEEEEPEDVPLAGLAVGEPDIFDLAPEQVGFIDDNVEPLFDAVEAPI